MAEDLQLLRLNGELLYTFDFTDQIPDEAVTISSIDYVVPTQLTQFADTDALDEFKGTAGLKCSASGKHGMTLQVECKATLSNGEKIPKYLTIRID